MVKNVDAPRKRVRKWKRVAKKDRRNLKMWAEGAREEILKPHIPGYTDALERGWRAERDYLQVVCNEFHARISWRLLDHEEPELPLPVYDPFAPVVLETLDEEEQEQRFERTEVLNARISRWFKYRSRRLRRPAKMDNPRDPWGILMAKLAGINTPPKARQAFQQYMHESYETEIAPAVAARWKASCVEPDGLTMRSKKGPDAPFRAQVARELFNELSAEDQEGLRARAREQAKLARDEYTAAMKKGPSKAPEDRQRCIDNLGTFMGQILRGVYEYTGLYSFVVFGGPIPQFNGEIRTLHVSHGRNLGPTPSHFPNWSKARFSRDVLDFMKEFLHTAFTPQECAESALPADDGDPLAGAKYRMAANGDLAFGNGEESDEDSDVSSDEDDSEDDSDSSSDSTTDEEAAGGKSKAKAKKKAQREKEKRRKEKEQAKEKAKKGKGKEKETDRTTKGGAKRKHGVGSSSVAEGSNKRPRGEGTSTSTTPLPPSAPVQPPELTYEQQRNVTIANNAALLRKVDEQMRVKYPEVWADIQRKKGAVTEKTRPKPRPRGTGASSLEATRRSTPLRVATLQRAPAGPQMHVKTVPMHFQALGHIATCPYSRTTGSIFRLFRSRHLGLTA
ncbi:hypothetical protein B0H15DRAFT_807672 [Mycena belliarum]|uniref:Uncharacterized protein n=1 Tax=Mycena belliarum TaxID=1033014 RepID=A0AAD6TKF3_9AGAR|nr:hypothetical protein B0H15DRAFT_807672 [Mycena belliae]